MTDRTCSIDDCERPVLARGWCRTHYYRWKRHGTVSDVRPWVNAPEGTKWCPRCTTYKSVTEFSASSFTKSGYQSWCKPCMATTQVGRVRVLSDGQKAHRREYHRQYLAEPANRAKHAAKSRRRRAVIRGGDTESYTAIEIAQRDGWMCQLCRRPINQRWQWPNPRSLSIDHIIPVSEGGDDVKHNVQAAHLRCNISKGTRGSDQLRLIG